MITITSNRDIAFFNSISFLLVLTLRLDLIQKDNLMFRLVKVVIQTIAEKIYNYLVN